MSISSERAKSEGLTEVNAAKWLVYEMSQSQKAFPKMIVPQRRKRNEDYK